MKKCVSMLLLGVFIFGLALSAAAEDVELRIAWWGSQNRHDRTIKVIELFEKEHPGIKVVYEPSSWPDHWTKLSTQAAGGNLPDVMQQDYSYLQEWVGRGLIMPLDDLVADGSLNFADVSDAALAGGRIDGKLYGVNLGTNSLGWVIDLDAFEKAGIDVPADNWTWADYEKVMMDLHDKLGIWGSTPINHFELAWKATYLALDEWVYSEDGKSFGYDNDQPLIDIFNMMIRLQDAGVIPTREQEIGQEAGTGLEDSPLVIGKSATTWIWSNQLVATWTAAGEDRRFKMIHLPRHDADGVASNYVKPSMFFAVPEQAKHPKEAAMFIDFFTNSVEANKILMAERGVPVSAKVADALKDMLTPAQRESFEYMGRVAQDSCPLPPSDPAGQNNFINNVYFPEFVDPVLTGSLSVEEGVKVLREYGEAALSE